MKQIARWCFSGNRLDDFAKFPWVFLDDKDRKEYCFLFFDVPELGKIAGNIDIAYLNKTVHYITSKALKIVTKHNGIVLRRNEDSLLTAFEPDEQQGRQHLMSKPEAYCAYSTVSCAIELKQMIETMKEDLEHVLLKRLKGRAIVSSDTAVLLKEIKMGRLEMLLFSNALYTIGDIMSLSDESDIIVDVRTYEQCSDYFVTKELDKKARLVIGISSY